MILKYKIQNPKVLSLGLVLLLLLFPFIFKAQTIPTTTVTGFLTVDSTMSAGVLQVSGTGRIDSSLVVGDTMHAQDIVVSGSARIRGNINLGDKLLFDASNNFGIGFKAGTISGTGTFLLGRVPGNPLPLFPVPCAAPAQSGLNFNIGAALQIYDPNFPTTSGILNIQTWPIGSSIDASVGSVTGNQGLLINYFCGNNTIINTGINGGIVFVGDKFQARKNVQIGQHGIPVDPNVVLNMYDVTNEGIKLWPANQTVKLIHDNFDQFTIFGNGNSHWGINMQIGFAASSAIQDMNTSLNIFNDTRDGIKFKTIWNNTKLISVNNANFASSPFILFATGTMSFTTNSGYNNLDIITITNSSLSSVNKTVFEVLGDGRTRIGAERVLSRPTSSLTVNGEIDCKSLFVLKPTTWADYVFSKKYKLDDLQVEEKYILENKHLKGLPSEKEVLENGYDINEMNAALLAKLEGAYLHIIKLQKEVDELKKKVK